MIEITSTELRRNMIKLDVLYLHWQGNRQNLTITPCGEPNNRDVAYDELRQESVILQG